jgi:hypothetical protein
MPGIIWKELALFQAVVCGYGVLKWIMFNYETVFNLSRFTSQDSALTI